MARELIVAWAGRHRRDAWERLCADYRERIGRWLPVRELAIRAKAAGEGRERRAAEGAALLAALPDPCWLVALDRRGEALATEELARRLGRLRTDWPHPVAFVLGSDLGLDPEVLAAARLRLSLSALTLPHELARLVLYEQLYRVLSLDAGIKYHRGPL
ncbi:MAG TPA: 23S rRNA (pseudouridine(1915)-N(3))-methyltransferase RlmH [Thermoanaerobaculia bacterium]|jgi:23S rRNA (pseudouridine1915-N3)-methyltransferase|nr:23S rRNA (pseudouridine(1915)-N(3))-methyltransferase RlmH [Thermoanaerobaculia bacterium]